MINRPGGFLARIAAGFALGLAGLRIGARQAGARGNATAPLTFPELRPLPGLAGIPYPASRAPSGVRAAQRAARKRRNRARHRMRMH